MEQKEMKKFNKKMQIFPKKKMNKKKKRRNRCQLLIKKD
jgi:hypothetical protein